MNEQQEKQVVKKFFLEGLYELETKRFEIIHARDNKTTGFYECFAHDGYLNEDLAFSATTIAELYAKTKEHIENAGHSIDLRTTPEPIQYAS